MQTPKFTFHTPRSPIRFHSKYPINPGVPSLYITKGCILYHQRPEDKVEKFRMKLPGEVQDRAFGGLLGRQSC